nr:hypothetical protein [Tanacetum cinerariifolium]
MDSKTTKEKVKSLALKAKVTREQTSDDSDIQGESNEEEAEEFNLLARNFQIKGRGNNFGNKGGESSKLKGACYNCGIEGHFASECRKPKENKAFVGGSWSDSEDGDEQPNDATCLMAIVSQKGNAFKLQDEALNFSKFKESSIALDDMLRVVAKNTFEGDALDPWISALKQGGTMI